MTTTKQIRAALDAATPGAMTSARLQEIADIPGGSWRMSSWHRRELLTEVCRLRESEKMRKAWLAWCLDQIERRNEIIAGMVNRCGCDREGGCDACDDARKLLEESK